MLIDVIIDQPGQALLLVLQSVNHDLDGGQDLVPSRTDLSLLFTVTLTLQILLDRRQSCQQGAQLADGRGLRLPGPPRLGQTKAGQHQAVFAIVLGVHGQALGVVTHPCRIDNHDVSSGFMQRISQRLVVHARRLHDEGHLVN